MVSDLQVAPPDFWSVASATRARCSAADARAASPICPFFAPALQRSSRTRWHSQSSVSVLSSFRTDAPTVRFAGQICAAMPWIHRRPTGVSFS